MTTAAMETTASTAEGGGWVGSGSGISQFKSQPVMQEGLEGCGGITDGCRRQMASPPDLYPLAHCIGALGSRPMGTSSGGPSLAGPTWQVFLRGTLSLPLQVHHRGEVCQA